MYYIASYFIKLYSPCVYLCNFSLPLLPMLPSPLESPISGATESLVPSSPPLPGPPPPPSMSLAALQRWSLSWSQGWEQPLLWAWQQFPKDEWEQLASMQVWHSYAHLHWNRSRGNSTLSLNFDSSSTILFLRVSISAWEEVLLVNPNVGLILLLLDFLKILSRLGSLYKCTIWTKGTKIKRSSYAQQ